MRTKQLRIRLFALLLATILLSMSVGCGRNDDSSGSGNLPTKEEISTVIRDFYQAWQQRDARGLWALLSTPSRKRFDEEAEKDNLDSGEKILEHMFADTGFMEISNGLRGIEPIIIRTRTLYGLVQCLVHIQYKGKKSREIVTLRPEDGKWRVVLELGYTVDLFDDDELLLILEPGDRGECDASLLSEISAIKDENERLRYVENLRGKTMTITGNVWGNGGGLSQDSYLLMEVRTAIDQADSVIVIFDKYCWTGHTFHFNHFEGDLLAEITPPFGDPPIEIKENQSITVTGVVGWYSGAWGYLSIGGAFLAK